MGREIKNPPTNIAGYDPTREGGDFTWDGEAAARAVDFFPAVLTHPDDSTSTKAGDPFTLQPWQSDYVATLFGWKRKDKEKTRRYKESFVAVPRKNGKSTLLSGIALYCLAAEGKLAAQVYSAASDRNQASLIYQMAARMIGQNKYLRDRLNPIDSKKRITYRHTGSFYQSCSGDAGTVHGTKPYAVLFDELHLQRDRRLYDGLRSGQGASPNSLFINITTAGWDRNSICHEVWRYARNVRDNVKPDPHFLPMLYEMKDGEDWTDETVWHRCNPNLDVSISIDFLREHCERAKSSPGYENTFRNLYLNQWTEQAIRWLSMRHWDACDAEMPNLIGEPCWAALDMSATTDITAFSMVFRVGHDKYAVLPHFWIPENSAEKKERIDGVPYRQWRDAGLVSFTPGDRIDHFCVRDDIIRLTAPYDLQELTVDRAMAAMVTTLLQESLGPDRVTEFPQTIYEFSGPSKVLERLVLGHELIHGGNPILRWMASNAAIEIDKNENIRPVKDKSTGRIDGIVSTVMGLGRAATAEVSIGWSKDDGVCL
jgi:phage terminase large subunit-like protein